MPAPGFDLGRLELPSRSRKLLLGASGGADSTALAWMLREAGYRRVVLCHLHHGIRGSEATRDRQFVARLARELGWEFLWEKADVPALARSAGLSLETAARQARQEFFFRCARQERTRTLLLAHHADDQLETILQNFFRGSGRRGLGGMQVRTEWRQARQRLEVWRPLLGCTREDLRRYLQASKRSWREDCSNVSLDPVRNRLRLELLPQLSALLGREVRGPILRLAGILREEDAWMDSLLPTRPPELSLRDLRELPAVLQRRQLLYWLREQLAKGEEMLQAGLDLGWQEVEAARQMLAVGGPAKINLPRGWHLRRRAGVLFLQAPSLPCRKNSKDG